MVERSSLAPTAVLVWLITPKLRITSPPRQYGRITAGADRKASNIRRVRVSGLPEQPNSRRLFALVREIAEKVTVELPAKTLPHGHIIRISSASTLSDIA